MKKANLRRFVVYDSIYSNILKKITAIENKLVVARVWGQWRRLGVRG